MRKDCVLLKRSAKETAAERVAGRILSGCFLLFFGTLLFFYRDWTYVIREQLFSTPWFGSVLFIFLALAVLCILIRRRFLSRAQAALCVFLVALISRMLLRYWIVMYPNGDVESYYAMGQAFCRGDFSFIRQTVSDWGIPEFAGMAALYGILGKIFSPTIEGYQLAFSFVTACSCLMVYLIAEKINPEAAFLDAFLFAFYPSNLLFSQVFSHQHLNLLFTLCCVLLLILAVQSETWKGRIFFSLSSGLLLLFAQYSHPSTLPTAIAVLIFLLILLLGTVRNGLRRSLQILCLLGCFLAGYAGGRFGTRAILIRSQLLDEELVSDSIYYAKIAMGLNYETSGMYSAKDTALFFHLPPDEKNRVAKEMILERTSDSGKLLELFHDKMEILWIYKDSAVQWPFYGNEDQLQKEKKLEIASELRDAFYQKQRSIGNAISLLDFFYVAAIYFFAFFGVLLGRHTHSWDSLLILIILGWAAVHLLIEIQTRYRFLAMPFLCIFAGDGICSLSSRLVWIARTCFSRRKAGCSNTKPGC